MYIDVATAGPRKSYPMPVLFGLVVAQPQLVGCSLTAVRRSARVRDNWGSKWSPRPYTARSPLAAANMSKPLLCSGASRQLASTAPSGAIPAPFLHEGKPINACARTRTRGQRSRLSGPYHIAAGRAPGENVMLGLLISVAPMNVRRQQQQRQSSKPVVALVAGYLVGKASAGHACSQIICLKLLAAYSRNAVFPFSGGVHPA